MKVYTIKTTDGRLIKRMEADTADNVVQYVKDHYIEYMEDYSCDGCIVEHDTGEIK